MSDDGMSMIPYSGGSNLDIVLRHNDSVVVFDRDSQQLVLRNTADTQNSDLELADCPLCHRPMREDSGSRGRGAHRGSMDPQAEFISPNYFRMLHNSLPGSTDSSTPPSPRRRLVRPALPDGTTSDPGYTRSSTASQGISSAAFSPDYFEKFFKEEKVLGRGGKGVVLLVKHVLDGVSLGHYACKRVPVGDDHEWLEKVLGEVQLLQHLTHQNLVSYRHVWLENARISTFGPSVPCAFILQQYCNAGDLHDYICGSVQTSATTQQLKERIRRRSKGEPEPPKSLGGPRTLQLDEIYSFFRDITSGLRYLHANGYIHRDLKPNNCLLHETSDGIRVLVSDFGEVQAQAAMRKSTGATGTLSYCAPEVLRQEYADGPFGNFSFKSDIFSLGMILYFLCFAELPYDSADVINEEREDLDQLREEITHWQGFNNVRRKRPDLPDRLYSFLERLLAVDPNQRPSADEVLSGIQAGANNASAHFKRASSAGPDLSGGTRLQPLDNSQQPVSSRTLSPTKRIPRNPVIFRRDSMFDTNDTRNGTVSAQDPSLENRESLSPDRDLVVRPRCSTSPTLSPTRTHPGEKSPLEPVSLPQQQLLPPPPASRFSLLTSLTSYTSTWHSLIPSLHLCAFLANMFWLFHLCSPWAVNPKILYSLLILGAVSLRAHSTGLRAFATALYLAVVGFGLQWGAVCMYECSATQATTLL